VSWLCGGGDGCACGGRRVELGGHEGLVVDGGHAARASERWEARGLEQVVCEPLLGEQEPVDYESG
jgi:hypothetical protein